MIALTISCIHYVMTGHAPSCMLLKKKLGKWLCAAFLKVGGLTSGPGSLYSRKWNTSSRDLKLVKV